MVFSEFIREKLLGPKSRISQAGQAVLEYLLVLIITVSLILGILYQFNDAFRNFLDTYFGDYIACLLESGELPSLGGDGPSQAECQPPYANFNISAGKALDGSNPAGQSPQSSGNSDQGESSESSSSGSNQPGSALRPSQVTSSGAPTNAERTTGAGQLRPGQQTYRGNQGSSSRDVGLGSVSGEGSAGGQGGRTIRRKKVVYIGEEFISEDEKKKKDRPARVTTLKGKKAGSGSLRRARQPLELPKARAVASSDDGKGFNFAFFLKFLLIAGIIIALIIFLGGQAMQIKKSWQKSE